MPPLAENQESRRTPVQELMTQLGTWCNVRVLPRVACFEFCGVVIFLWGGYLSSWWELYMFSCCSLLTSCQCTKSDVWTVDDSFEITWVNYCHKTSSSQSLFILPALFGQLSPSLFWIIIALYLMVITTYITFVCWNTLYFYIAQTFNWVI